MRLTRRGRAALVVVVAAVGMAVLAGPRALNAVVAPVVVALVAGAVQVRRAGEPTVERTTPRRGFPGETRRVELTVEGGGVGRVVEQVSDGLSAAVDVERSIPTTIEYDVEYERRGVHDIGPTTVRVRDVLGLVETAYELDVRTSVVVYPNVYSVGDPVAALRSAGPNRNERTEFDGIREYDPADPLRDVNWKASAKHDELLVTEFTDPGDEEAIAIAGRSTAGHDDEMATALATILVAASRVGLTTELTVPDGHLARGYGENHKNQALELLARTGHGDVDDAAWDRAAIRVDASLDGTTVTIDRAVYDLADITTSRDNPLLAEVGT